jgi:hypothetical protein
MVAYFFGSIWMMGHYSKRLRLPNFFSAKPTHNVSAADPFAARAPVHPVHTKEENEAHREFLRVHRSPENEKQKKW